MLADRAPGVYIEPSDPQVRPVAPSRTDVAAFIGLAERGPLGVPTRVTSFKEFAQVFGSFYAPAYLAYAVNAFFENGGVAAWIVRAAAPGAQTMATVASPTRLTLSPTLVVVPGAVVALAQKPATGNRIVVLREAIAADPAGTWIDISAPIAGVSALEKPPLDPAKPLFLSTGAVVSQATLSAVNGNDAATVAASSPGSWGNAVALRCMTHVVAQTSATGAPQKQGAAIPVASVARFERGGFIRLRQGALAPSYHVICYVDVANSALIVSSDLPGMTYGSPLDKPVPLAFDASAPLCVECLAIHAVVLEGDQVVEDYDGLSPLWPQLWADRWSSANSRLSLDPASLPNPSLDPDAWPADTPGILLAGGTDGTRAAAPADLVAALNALAPFREPTLIAVPDACASGAAPQPPPPVVTPPVECTDPVWLGHPSPLVTPQAPQQPPPPEEAGPAFDATATLLVMLALVNFCENDAVDPDLPPHPSFRFALTDVPAGTDPLTFRPSFDASRAAIHWPWAGVYDPLSPTGDVRFVPPCGHVAGVFARLDLADGPHHSAANSELRWIADVASAIDGEAQAVYNDQSINCIRALPNRGIRVYGARTLSSDSNWLYVPVRRLVSMIEAALLNAMQWAVFEPNTPTLRLLMRRSCLTLLDALWQRGALAGASPADAYYVTCDASNNTAATQANGQLIVEIGVAPVRPAEFIIFRVGHQQETLEVFEVNAA
ncbi:MAG TPA: phage tail sheath C-terminal domain-containing protein [Candidatus Binatia bacterium]|nr:phage tail sheath C-terminal domain-containing protein [Candidatus Binatia bacterium]